MESMGSKEKEHGGEDVWREVESVCEGEASDSE